jgi:hypothetical protein
MERDRAMEILSGQILESPFWSEPVRVLSV